MKKTTVDARRLTHTTLTELRKRGVGNVQGGQSPETVAAALGINRSTMYGWLARYRDGGWGALDARKRGRRKRKLDPKATLIHHQDIICCVTLIPRHCGVPACTPHSSGLIRASLGAPTSWVGPRSRKPCI
jgi:transposase-like protein